MFLFYIRLISWYVCGWKLFVIIAEIVKGAWLGFKKNLGYLYQANQGANTQQS